MKRIAILAISAIALTANGKESGSPQKSVDVKLAKAVVLEDLKDPESARLRNLFISNSPNIKGEMMQHLCGEINAKNAMGGYVGYRRFFADNESAMIDPGIAPGSDTGQSHLNVIPPATGRETHRQWLRACAWT